MIQSLYSAAAGLTSTQQNIDTIANNISNTNTAGFKASRADFKDAIYTAMQNPDPTGAGNNLQLGHGAILAATLLTQNNGSYIQTGRSLDFAVMGDGFFAVRDENGAVKYTRDGTFKTSLENGENYIVNANGEHVLDQNGDPIHFQGDANDLFADSKGNLSIDGNAIGKIGVFSFSNPESLKSMGSNCYEPSANSGNPEASDAKIQQGFYEGSNVDESTEITRLMQAQRAYSLIGKAITTADEMEGMANNLKG
ncbi:MAG: flagellar hook-basal body protein [Bacillota bacterium]|nr:flagellar hook-basal body protein [Bacillota bacterium]